MKDAFIILSLSFIVFTQATRLDIPTDVPPAPVETSYYKEDGTYVLHVEHPTGEVDHFEITPEMASSLPAIGDREEDAGRFEWFEVLEALRLCETAGQPRQGLGAVGDGGKSIGPFQIGILYYRDATARDYPEAPVGGIAYEDLRDDRWASEAIVLAYMRRWAPEEFRRLEEGTATLDDAARIARLHNGGPTLSKTSATDGYAKKFANYLLGTEDH